MHKIKIYHLNKILYFLLSVSIFIGYFFGEDSSGSGGFIADFNNTLIYIDNLKIGIKYYFKEGVSHFPLHYYLKYIIFSFTNDLEILRLVYCLLSLFVPILFYLSLKIKFNYIDKNNLLLFSMVIFLLPSFRSGAIWANSQLTAIIFFLLAVIFFCKWEKNKEYSKFTLDLFAQIFFLSLSVYTRQLYAIVFLYLVYLYFLKLDKKIFLQSCFVIFLFSLPGFYFVSLLPNTLTLTFTTKIQNSIFVNLSILSFYLIPIFLILFFNKKIIFNFLKKKEGYIFFIIMMVLLILSFWFDYNYKLGGGYFIKLSMLLFNNLSIFFFSSIVGLFFCFYLCLENKNNILIIALLIFGMTSYQIFQKYFEPMFLIILFTMMTTEITKLFLIDKKSILIFKLYIFIYLGTAIVNDTFQITKNL